MSSSHDQECNEKISYYFDQICIFFEESSLKILQSYSAITFVNLSPSILIMYFFLYVCRSKLVSEMEATHICTVVESGVCWFEFFSQNWR